ncbi:MAG: leucyl aminopeptidase [Planctomycetota bacterium]|nr:leucyl aminopeptidase [Planctomycetota bacterium]
MHCESFSNDLILSACDCLVLGLDNEWAKSSEFAILDEATNGLLKRLIETEEISTKPLKVTQIVAPAGLQVKLLLTIGLGSPGSCDPNVYTRAAAAALKVIASKKRGIVRVVGFQGTGLSLRGAVSGAMVGCVGQDLFRKEKSLYQPDCIQWVGLDEATVQAGVILGEAINFTRRLVNLPPNYLYPETLADEAMQLGREHAVTVEVWDRKRLEAEGCGALLGVARGSVRDPRLVILRYYGAASDAAPTVLVGKGVTFDSGGYSIKPTDGMLTMKCDMAGAATVLGIMKAAAQFQVKHNLVAIIGLVENLISGDAFKLGDVLTARSGKTIEIHNTDAEGRLVLADCLNVALDQKPARIVDFATLTGACCVGLGLEISGLMTNNEAWQSEIKKSADACGEYTWPLPMHAFFSEQIAGKIADIKNVGEGRYGGAMTAAKFLQEFVADVAWTHIDIAGPAFLDSPKPWCDAGGTGTLVRTFVELLCS